MVNMTGSTEGASQRAFIAPPVCEVESNSNTKIRELTPVQKKALDTLREHIHSDTTLTEKHKAFCTDSCLLRYLRARDFHIKPSEALLRSTLKWRDEYKPDEISPYGVMDEEAATGKIFVAGRDLNGRPILYMRPAYQNTKNYEEQNRLTVYMLERCVQSMDTTCGVESLCLIIDYHNYSIRNAPPMHQSKEIMQILSDHYPERLGIAMLMDAPGFFHMTYKLLGPFIPAETKKKVHFVSGDPKEGGHKQQTMARYINLNEIPCEYGGHEEVTYNHDVYWKNEKDVWDARHTN